MGLVKIPKSMYTLLYVSKVRIVREAALDVLVLAVKLVAAELARAERA